MLQHVIFVVARVPLFAIYTLLTCCCDKGEDYPENERFIDRVIHFDYVLYELEENRHFDNHAVGLNEVEFIRSLNLVRSGQRIEMRASGYGHNLDGPNADVQYLQRSLR